MAGMFDDRPAPTSLPRSVGEIGIAVAGGRLRGLRQAGASKLLFPRGGASEAVIVNTAGGIAGGDRFSVSADVAGGALTLTTQACERVYRALDTAPATLSTRLTAGPGATLAWLPQETILFDCARLRRRLSIDMDPTATILLCEALVFGRRARGERVRTVPHVWRL